MQLFHHKAENPRAPDRRGTVCSTLSSLSIYSGYILPTLLLLLLFSLQGKQRQQLLPPLISACPGVQNHLAHPVDSAASSLLVITVILPSSVFTLAARPESCQNPQRRKKAHQPFARAREVPNLLGPSACGPRNPHRRLITQHAGAPTAKAASSELSQNLRCPLAQLRYPPNTPEHKSRPGCPELLCCCASSRVPPAVACCCPPQTLAHRFAPNAR